MVWKELKQKPIETIYKKGKKDKLTKKRSKNPDKIIQVDYCEGCGKKNIKLCLCLPEERFFCERCEMQRIGRIPISQKLGGVEK